MAKLLSTIIDGFISSKKFVSGFLGEGWRIGKRGSRYTLEVDDIIVRNTMTVFELLISKIRAVKGALGISQGCGKVKAVREETDAYILTLEDDNTFRANDLVRCQSFGKSARSYWVKVRSVSDTEITIDKSEFSDAMSTPEIGDELVQFGNTTDSARQSAIFLSADENGVPAIDVLQGINSKSFEGCTKVRVGGLDGIVDGDFPEGIQDFGIYCENGYFKGTIAGGGGYMLRSDGTGYICNGAIYWDHQKKVHFDGEVVLGWENLPVDAKDLLKGDKGEPGEKGETGEDANLLPWVKEWDNNSPLLKSDGLLSPRIFSGSKDDKTGKLTGVAMGREIIEVNGVKKTGIFGLASGNLTFSVDAETGEAFYGGSLNVAGNTMINEDGKFITKDGEFTGSIAVPIIDLDDSDAIVYEDGYLLQRNLAVANCPMGKRIYLPADLGFNGKVVTIFNQRFPPYTKLDFKTYVKTQNGIGIGGLISQSIELTQRPIDPVEVAFAGSVLRFIGCIATDSNSNQYIKWFCLNYY